METSLGFFFLSVLQLEPTELIAWNLFVCEKKFIIKLLCSRRTHSPSTFFCSQKFSQSLNNVDTWCSAYTMKPTCGNFTSKDGSVFEMQPKFQSFFFYILYFVNFRFIAQYGNIRQQWYGYQRISATIERNRAPIKKNISTAKKAIV